MEPLNLPRGSVRSLIVFALIGGTVLAMVFAPTAAWTAMSAILAAAVRDYFGTRAWQNEQDGPPLPPPSQ